MSGEAKPRRRGAYANGERTRAALVDAAFEVFAEQGFQRMSIRQIAEAIGTSHTALLHHFGSKDALLGAVLARREEREGPERARLLQAEGFLDAVPAIMKINATEPGVIQLDTVLRIEGLNPDHAAHDFVMRQQQEFYESVLAELTSEDAAGHLRDGLDLPVVARLVTSLVEGIQIAWLTDRSVDMGAHLAAFMDLIRRPS
ncbi:MAG TPA: helix-turn-helix domain-containing protein [Propionicimonas sp.]|nr:helix-turn-helix domain-containing protein [Propionicimonas sp.]HRA06871.1 helix-turn-helix domain-containing protein [Propionicimonas sp.]